MVIKGSVNSVIFYNQDNGYSVLDVDVDGKKITCVGLMPSVSAGEVLEMEGKFVVHAQFGEQFQVQKVTISAPKTNEAIIRYLSSGLLKGVGAVTAAAIVKEFGDRTLEIIETNPSELSKVKGISDAKADAIGQQYGRIKVMQEQIMFLQNFDITTNMALKIYAVYGEHTKLVLCDNPYKMVDDVDGIGFATADKIARNMGLEFDSPFRVRAAIVYLLKDAAERCGNTYIAVEELRDETIKLLELEKNAVELFEDAVEQLQLGMSVSLLEIGGVIVCALSKFVSMERYIAAKLIKLDFQSDKISNVETLIAEYSRINQITLHSGQDAAIRNAVDFGVSVITGGPGTGKTTIIKCISYILNAHGYKTEYCTPTGRASKRLSEATGEEAKTIHRMLGMQYSAGKLHFSFNENNQLQADVVIIDELSMVDVSIFYSLLKAMKQGSRLILVGDKDQLPSVGAGNVLADIIGSEIVNVNFLTQIYRQSQDSLIVSNAHLINNCKMPLLNNQSKDFFISYKNSGEEVAETVVELVSKRLPPFVNVNALDVQVLSPMRNNAAGVTALNVLLQDALNPKDKSKNEFFAGGTKFRLGDKVMQTVNDYQLEWNRLTPGGYIEKGSGVFNGDIGVVTEVNPIDACAEITFDDGRVALYGSADLSDITLAYAITIHKSQGSEFDVVVIPLCGGPPTIINKNLLYTAVTRAKKVVVLVGSKSQLNMMVRNNYIIKRNTLLKKFLLEENEKFKTLFGKK